MATQTQSKTDPKPADTNQPRWWNVVLLDDQDHGFDYVIRMLQQLFAHSKEKAFQIAKKVDKDGRGICMVTHKELAELKRDQILGFGRDPLTSSSKGSMTAIIEPSIGGGDDAGGDGEGGNGKDEGGKK